MTDRTGDAAQVRQILTDHLGADADDVIDTARLEDLGADNLDQVEMVIELEVAFAVRIDETEAEKCETVGDWVGLIERKRA